MAKRSAEETRQTLIDVGLQMLYERGPSAAVAHIRLSSVLRRAGLTTGAAYRIWDDQNAFQRDLAVHALGYREAASTERTVQAVVPALQAGGDWYDALRAGADANVYSYPRDVAFLVALAIRASAFGDTEISSCSRRRHDEAVSSFGRMYAVLLAWSGRRLRAGFHLDDLASALSALSEGFALQHASDIQHPRMRLNREASGPGDVDWSMLGMCAAAICERMTEPDPDGAGVERGGALASLLHAVGTLPV